VLQGRLDAVQATNVALQQQLAATRQADVREARPVRAKGAPAGTTAARLATTRPARAPRVASAPASKTAVRRKRGRTDGN
jgi:hypothetical protein